MVTEKTLMKFGLTKDDNNSKLKEVFKNNVKLKEIHIDVCSKNPLITSSETPFMLLLRTTEKRATVLNDNHRLVLKKNDNYETHILNVLFQRIKECYYKVATGYSEFVLNIQNIYYKITVFN